VLVHDIGAVYAPVVVTTTTSVGAGEVLTLLHVIESVSPGLRVTRPLVSEVGDDPLDEPLDDACVGSDVIPLTGLPSRYAEQLDALAPLGAKSIALTVTALTPIAFMFTVSTPPNSSAVTVSVLLAPSDGIAPWNT
jgi:hypothetical protein